MSCRGPATWSRRSSASCPCRAWSPPRCRPPRTPHRGSRSSGDNLRRRAALHPVELALGRGDRDGALGLVDDAVSLSLGDAAAVRAALVAVVERLPEAGCVLAPR